MSKLKTIAGLGYNVLQSKIIKGRRPVFLSLFVTNKCNLRCKYCFVVDETLPKSILQAQYSLEEIKEIVDQFHAMGTRMIFMLGGEPLVHPQIEEIVNYIVDKGIYLHVITNGTLLAKRLPKVRKAHVICVSLDGLAEVNDSQRGQGTFARAVEGIKAAVKAGMATRIHAVLSRVNLDAVRDLAELSRDLGVALTISPPNFLGETTDANLRITREEYKKFWAQYLAMQDQGLPIENNRKAILKCRDWPVDYHQYIEQGQKFEDYRPIFCLNGYTYVALGAEGVMYNCINLGCLNGPNIHEVGIQKAWDTLLEWRPNCTSCASINCIETAMMLNLDPASLLTGFRFHRGKA